jgi:glyoxylase-like metal-dependent hydrolase (beta-lactamase superfamily II)
MAGRIEAETLRELLDAQQPVTGLDIRSQTASLTATHTPSHTNESTSYVLNETAVFAGDTLLTNGVGRPDLQATPEAARRRACALFASLRVRLVAGARDGFSPRGDETPEQILKRRYAKGEIEREEYQRRLEDLRR